MKNKKSSDCRHWHRAAGQHAEYQRPQQKN